MALLKGKEPFLRAQHTSDFKDKLTAAFGGVDVFLFDGEKDEAADILDECRSFGLMSGHKLVIVDNAESFVKDTNRSLVERYVQAPNDEATLVLRAETWRAGKLDKMIAEVGSIVLCDSVSPDIAAKWCRLRARKRHETELDEKAAWALIARYGPDLGRLQAEIAKLAIAAGTPESGGGVITVELVVEMCGGSREIEPWSVQEPMLRGNAEYAIVSLRRILENAPRDSHVPVAMACAQLAANLHAIGNAGRADLQMVGKARKLWGERVRPIAAGARIADPTALRRLLYDALEADAKGKSGGGTPAIDLEVMAVRFAEVLGGS